MYDINYVLIKKKRKEKKLSLRKLAKISGVSADTINRIENGEIKKPDLTIIINICQNLQLDLEKVIGNTKIYKEILEYVNNKEVMKKC